MSSEPQCEGITFISTAKPPDEYDPLDGDCYMKKGNWDASTADYAASMVSVDMTCIRSKREFLHDKILLFSLVE